MLRHFVVGLLLTTLVPLAAQPVVGVKGGVDRTLTSAQSGTAAIPGLPEPEVEDSWGFHGGAFAEFDLSEQLFLRPELLYAQRSHRYTAAFDTTILFITARVEAEVAVKRTYLELPILLGYRVSERTSVFLGPAAGYLLGSHETTTGQFSVGGFFPGMTVPFNETSSTTTGLEELRLALVAGLNWRSLFGLDLGVRYMHGIGYLESDTEAIRTRQSTLQLAVGYAFLR
ncbi:MAG TPA: porin family protein [Flavobacteriales bacterium]|nr:porin family protein [Flavobacteriales bacterium]